MGRRQKLRAHFGSLSCDPTLAAAKVASLYAAGASLRAIATGAGCDTKTIRMLLSGRRRSLHRDTHDAILAMPSEAVGIGTRSVSALRSTRQVRALTAIGHPQHAIEAATGLAHNLISELMNGRRVTVRASTAVSVDQGYRVLSRVPGSSAQARNRGQHEGWATPAEWAGDIDDPSIDPVANRSTGMRVNRSEDLVEDADWIRETDNASWAHVAERLEVDVDLLHTYRTRVRDRFVAEGRAA